MFYILSYYAGKSVESIVFCEHLAKMFSFSVHNLMSSPAAIKFYRMAMQLVPDIEFKINYSRGDADRGGGN